MLRTINRPLSRVIDFDQPVATGEGILHDWDMVQREGCVVLYYFESSGSHTKIDDSEASCLDWESVVNHFIKEPNDHFKIYSGIGGWKEVRTSSPQVDETMSRIIIDGITGANKQTLHKRVGLNQRYYKEKIKYFHYFKDTVTETFVDKLFKNVTDKIVQLPYAAIAVEITTDKSIFFEIRFSETILHFKLIISDPNDVKAFFALYQNSHCIDNGVGPITDILNHLLALKYDGVSANPVTTKSLQA